MEIQDENTVYVLANQVKELALGLGFTLFNAGLISTASAEIAMNTVRHAVGGTANVQPCLNDKGIEIQIADNGPGISNIELAMQDSYSTRISLGLGLGAAKRSVDEFIIDTSDQGTLITLRSHLPVPREEIDTGMVSFPCVGEQVNGDAYFVKGYEGDKLIAAVYDGAGKGEKADESTQIVSQLLKKHYQLPLDEIISLCHQELLSRQMSRGVEIALVRITPDTVESVKLGNVSIHAHSQPRASVSPQNGSMGLLIPSDIHIHRFKRPQQFCFVLHSDGVVDVDYSATFLNDYSAQKVAETLFDRHAITDDDSTVVIVKG